MFFLPPADREVPSSHGYGETRPTDLAGQGGVVAVPVEGVLRPPSGPKASGALLG